MLTAATNRLIGYCVTVRAKIIFFTNVTAL